ncbi:MAG: hypothetical protein EXX96DRAFT_607390 [Benjaminiella poitrasii]|nr:MAG: hypothetical protein EXX96DRAFT_607390 [Benjaminiella poitrasii]
MNNNKKLLNEVKEQVNLKRNKNQNDQDYCQTSSAHPVARPVARACHRGGLTARALLAGSVAAAAPYSSLSISTEAGEEVPWADDDPMDFINESSLEVEMNEEERCFFLSMMNWAGPVSMVARSALGDSAIAPDWLGHEPGSTTDESSSLLAVVACCCLRLTSPLLVVVFDCRRLWWLLTLLVVVVACLRWLFVDFVGRGLLLGVWGHFGDNFVTILFLLVVITWLVVVVATLY